MHRSLKWGLALTPWTFAVPQALAQLYDPNVVVSTNLTSVAQSDTVNLLNLGSGMQQGLVSRETVSFGSDATAGNISFTGTAGIYMGNVAGVTAAPWTGTAREAGNYFAAQPNGGISISYTQQQQYFGIMWGSVDNYNTLSFYNNGTLVEQLGGRAITSNANGNQAGLGTYYVNMNFTNGTGFDRVVATSASPAFEFNMIAYSTQTQAITQAQVLAAGPAGTPQVVNVPVNAAPVAGSPLLLGLLAWWRRRRGKASA